MKLKTKKTIKKSFQIIVAVLILATIAFGFYCLGSLSGRRKITPDTSLVRVKLFYFNKLKGSVAAVERSLPASKAQLTKTLNLLLKGNLTLGEKAQGFVSDFPHPDFKLLGASLKNGVLTLKFSEAPGFTSGGAERMEILAEQIKKTALQFPQVKKVAFDPEYLFQP